MYANRRDATEREIVDALVGCGCLVRRATREPYDALVTRGGAVYLLEIKTRTGTLTPAQLEFIALGWPLHVVRSPTEALRAVGLIT